MSQNRSTISEVFGLENVDSQDININDFKGDVNSGSAFDAPKYKQRPQSVDYTSVDNYMFDELVKKSPKLQKQIGSYVKGGEKLDENGQVLLDDEGKPLEDKPYEPFQDLSRDVFQTFYKKQPKFRDDKLLDDSGKRHKQMLEQYMQSEEYEQLHKRTQHDLVNSAIASQTAYKVLYQQIQYQMEQQEQEGNNPNPNGQPGGNGAGNGPGGGGMPSMKDEMNKLNKDMNEMESMINSYGLEDGESKKLSYKEKKELLELIRNSSRFRAFTELVGRYRLLAKQIFSSKERYDAPTIQGVTLGSDIGSTLTSDLLLYMDEKSRPLFYKKWLERKLMQYERYEYTESGRGPIICCVDTSGSIGYEEEKWEKALALSLLEMAQLQKRDFAVLFFDSRLNKVMEIPHGYLKPKQVIEIAEHYTGGGTNFTEPMLKAFDIIESKPNFKKADIIFLTDGQAHLNHEEEMLAKKKALKTRVQTILIGCGEGAEEYCSLKNLTDSFITLNDFDLKDASTEDILSNITSQGLGDTAPTA